MATLSNKKKLAVLNEENCEEHPRSNLAQNSNTPSSQEDYITQVSEEIECRVTNKLSEEFSRTESRILGELSRLDDLILNPLIHGHSGTATETSRNAYGTNQGTNQDDPRVIFILKQVYFRVRRHETLARKSQMTVSIAVFKFFLASLGISTGSKEYFDGKKLTNKFEGRNEQNEQKRFT